MSISHINPRCVDAEAVRIRARPRAGELVPPWQVSGSPACGSPKLSSRYRLWLSSPVNDLHRVFAGGTAEDLIEVGEQLFRRHAVPALRQ